MKLNSPPAGSQGREAKHLKPKVGDEGWEVIFIEPPSHPWRLGGIGDPDYVHSAVVPEIRCAMPVRFVTTDDMEWHRAEGEDLIPIALNDSPTYEGQNAYLDAMVC